MPTNSSGSREKENRRQSLKYCWELIASSELFDAGYSPPFVSVVVTAHNYAHFLETTIRSVLAQTYTEFECIIINDASTDDTENVLRSVLDSMNDARFQAVTLPKNVGQLGAQSEGLARSKGMFVLFLDADDLLHPRFLERHLFTHLHLRWPVGFTSSNQWNIDGYGTVLSFHHSDFTTGFENQDNVHHVIGEGDQAVKIACIDVYTPTTIFMWSWGTQSTMLFRRAILDMIMPPVQDASSFKICADYYIVRFAQFFVGSALINEALGSYRRHGENNFCSNMLLAKNVSVGDMRRHPDFYTFNRLAHKILLSRKEQFLSAFSEVHYLTLTRHFKTGRRTKQFPF